MTANGRAQRAKLSTITTLMVMVTLGAVFVAVPETASAAVVATDFSFITRAIDTSSARPYGQAISADTWAVVACKGDDLDFYKTTNAGVTWSKVSLDNAKNNNLTNCRLAVRDANQISIIAHSSPGTYAPSARRVRIYDSANGGTSWSNGYDFGRNANGTVRSNSMDINYDSAGVGFACIYGRDAGSDIHTARRSGDVWLQHTTFSSAASFCTIAGNSTNVLLTYGKSGSKLGYRLSQNSASSFSAEQTGPIIGICLTAQAGAGNAIVSNQQWVAVATNQGCENVDGGAAMYERTANGGASYGSGNVFTGNTETPNGYYVEAANAENYVAAFKSWSGTDRLRFALSTSAGASWTSNVVPVGSSVTLGNMDIRPGKGGPLIFYTQNGASPARIDVAVGDGPTLMGALVGTGQFIFCSALGSSRGGYDLLEDVTKFDRHPLPDASLSSGFSFKGNSGDFAYLAKSWGGVGGTAVGVKAAEVYFTIEAAVDLGIASVFRAAFSGVPATGDAGAPTLDKGDGDGRGKWTGDFAEHVEVEFLEVENDWSVRLFYVDGGTSRTQLGPAWIGGNPNTPTGYRFVVDSRTGSNFIGVTDVNGNFLVTGGTQVKMTLPAGLTEEPWYSQWFVGYATSTFFKGMTWLSDDRNLSTCVRDNASVLVADANGCVANGDCGRLVGDGTGQSGSDAGGAAGEGGTTGGGAKDDAVLRMFPGSGSTNGALIYSLVTVILFAVGAWRLTGGQVERGVWRPGNPIAIGMSAYFGLCIASVVFYDTLFWVAAAIAALAIAGAVAKAVAAHSRE